MNFEHLLVSQDGPMLRVTINRPEKRNPLSQAVLDELTHVFTRQRDNEALKLVVLSGSGEDNFAAGGDLKKLAEIRSEAQTRDMVQGARASLSSIRDFPVPVIAALNGDALGGGAELAVACDFIVARHGARIGFIQGRLNISTAWSGGISLLERVGTAHGLRLLCRSEMVDADQAVAIGLIDAAASAGETLEVALQAFCAPILVQARPVLCAFKELARARGDGQPRAALDEIEVHHFVETWLHEDHWRAAEKILSPRRSS